MKYAHAYLHVYNTSGSKKFTSFSILILVWLMIVIGRNFLKMSASVKYLPIIHESFATNINMILLIHNSVHQM